MVEEKIDINGLVLMKPSIFNDERGAFFESYNKLKYDTLIDGPIDFMQDNISISKKNVLRGLHFQKNPMSQGKLVQVIKGSVLDIAVDLRKTSPTYGEHYKVELNDKNKFQLWIPEGFAHGFVTLQDDTIFSYKCTNLYSKDDEMDLLWNDPLLNIDWGIESPILSHKDKSAMNFRDFNSPFK